jgi:hypothetical protein
VVKKHGGTVRFESELGKGTTFVLRLPLTPCTAVEMPERIATAPASSPVADRRT